ncbi:mandelate racemase [Nakamurella sp. YIM 132087]|uniref:Mandelate racemase n=1 Tax=Nakamurella alba TaxID=2665158 RepID=A0A7K1FFT3_9ACTN|nr:mandelate racemase/muconate lactonizing enzyme family protein [Nakamurella alba]MTD12329.1 mandelate racemase [Nakamurella alba]
MKITAVDCFGYRLGYAHGEYVMSGGRAAVEQTGTIVRLRTDEGLEGWGEVTPLGATYLPAFTDGIRAAIGLLAPHLIGADPTNISGINRMMDAVLLGQGFAKSPIDIACWDLLGRSVGRPVADLLGGVLQPDFPLYEAVPLGTPDSMADFVARRQAAGINRFQLKVGNDPLEDAARTRAAVEAADPRTIVIADSNGGWNLLDARRAYRAMADLPVYVEQPCRTTEDCALAAAGSSLPLVLDESVCVPEDIFRAKQAGASSVNLKISRVGGLTAAARARDLMQSLNLMVSIEDTWGGDIVSAAVSHIAASTRPESLLMTSFFNDWTDGHVAGYLPRSVDGRGSAPTGPGLGIDVDTTAFPPALFTIA